MKALTACTHVAATTLAINYFSAACTALHHSWIRTNRSWHRQTHRQFVVHTAHLYNLIS